MAPQIDPDIHDLVSTIQTLLGEGETALADDRPELEQALTDTCAAALALEAERLRTKRRMIAALADALGDDTERARAEELAERHRVVTEAQEALRRVAETLRRHAGGRSAA